MTAITGKVDKDIADKGLLIHQLFEKQKNKTPHAVAVIFNNHQLTYSQLSQKADNLANQILTISPDSLIAGLSTHRSIETIISVLAILKSGKAYLPLDSDYPHDRLQQIINDSGIDLCLAPSQQKSTFNSLSVKTLASDIEYPIASSSTITNQSACYVLYT